MTSKLTRLAALNGVLIILFGITVAGIAGTWLVTRDVYHQPIPIDLGDDYRAWMMAHLEGLLNGLMVIAFSLTVVRHPMSQRRGRVLFCALMSMGWGNTVAATLSPIFAVRAMAWNGDPVNDAIISIYAVALVGTIASFYIVIRHLSSGIGHA